ncbi:MAG TPA: ABC transporter ATP-binding protein [bacterium]|nr:ABC transporter ATP-binding protein [bacterium]
MSDVRLREVSKSFGEVRAVDHVSLDVQAGEFVSLLGPSGCGKTTTLRLIAGFERVTSGDIFIGGGDVTTMPAYQRNIGMVFQHYALFPHMTVRENVAFGLRMRRVPAAEAARRVSDVLDLLHLSGLGNRYHHQLSGGQQQRVALARALVIKPQILLLDEPLSNLDAKLREEMRVELRQVQRQVGITTVFVTHDQEEALVMSDRIAVMNHGRIIQYGTPADIYQRPAHSFVAGFIGQSNLLWGEVQSQENGLARVRVDSGLEVVARSDQPVPPGRRVLVMIRQSRVKVGRETPQTALNSFAARLEFVTYLGEAVQYLCRVGELRLVATAAIDADAPSFQPGAPVTVSWRPDDCLVLRE